MNKYLQIIGDTIIDILETVVIALSIFVLIYLVAFQPHEVSGQSMDGIAGFHNGQYILTDKITYRFKNPQRGDVIVFRYPLNPSLHYIKRIIGLPSEQVKLIKNKIVIYTQDYPAGFVLDESKYIGTNVETQGKAYLKEGKKIKIPENKYFVMGDNRPHSSDSRTWGLVDRSEIVGISRFRYWPPNEIGLIKMTVPH